MNTYIVTSRQEVKAETFTDAIKHVRDRLVKPENKPQKAKSGYLKVKVRAERLSA